MGKFEYPDHEHIGESSYPQETIGDVPGLGDPEKRGGEKGGDYNWG